MEENIGTKVIPEDIRRLLKEYQDMTPEEPPTQLPPKRDVDYTIELVPRVVPYHMAPTNLEELKPWLKQLLDGGSKAPYEAPACVVPKEER